MDVQEEVVRVTIVSPDRYRRARDRRRRRLCVLVACLLSVGLLSESLGDEPSVRIRTSRRQDTAQSQPAPSKDLVADAYAASKEAKTVPQFTEVIDLCRQALDAEPAEKTAAYLRTLMSWAYNKRGESFAQTGKEADAAADFEASVQLDPTRWKAIHNRGVSAAMAGRFDDAMADFDRTIELKPDFANAWFNRGELRYEIGEFQNAIEDYDRSISLNDNDADAFNSRGHAHYRLGNYQESIRDYTSALGIDDRHAAAYTNRGDAYADVGYYAQAARDYRQAIEIDPNLGRAYQSSAWLMATCPDEQYRRPELAVTAAQRAIDLDGDGDYRYLDTLAAAHANAGDFEAAAEIARRVTTLAPPDVAARYQQRLEMYERREPYRDMLPGGSQSANTRGTQRPTDATSAWKSAPRRRRRQ